MYNIIAPPHEKKYLDFIIYNSDIKPFGLGISTIRKCLTLLVCHPPLEQKRNNPLCLPHTHTHPTKSPDRALYTGGNGEAAPQIFRMTLIFRWCSLSVESSCSLPKAALDHMRPFSCCSFRECSSTASSASKNHVKILPIFVQLPEAVRGHTHSCAASTAPKTTRE